MTTAEMATFPADAAPHPGSGRTLGRGRAWLILAGLAALAGWGLARPAAPQPKVADGVYTDVDLYRDIAGKVAEGANYYVTAITMQAQHHYPTTPVMVVRMPTLAYVEAALGHSGALAALLVLAGLAVAAMAVRLDRAGVRRGEWLAALLILASTFLVYPWGQFEWMHDSWAGVLILLAVALRTDKRWWPSVILGLAAVCFRELASPFLLVMVLMSWRRRREALAWCGAAAAFAAIYASHALAVVAVQPTNPVPSQGWVEFGGWQFILTSIQTHSMLAVMPAAVTAVVVPLALAGWLLGPAGDRAVPALCAAFIGCFAVIGRPENSYWALLYTAPLLMGVAFAPRALVALAGAVSGARGRQPELAGD